MLHKEHLSFCLQVVFPGLFLAISPFGKLLYASCYINLNVISHIISSFINLVFIISPWNIPCESLPLVVRSAGTVELF